MIQCGYLMTTTLEGVTDAKKPRSLEKTKIQVVTCTSNRCSGHNNKGVIKDVKPSTSTCPDCGHPLMTRKILPREVSTFYYKRNTYDRKKDVG